MENSFTSLLSKCAGDRNVIVSNATDKISVLAEPWRTFLIPGDGLGHPAFSTPYLTEETHGVVLGTVAVCVVAGRGAAPCCCVHTMSFM